MDVKSLQALTGVITSLINVIGAVVKGVMEMRAADKAAAANNIHNSQAQNTLTSDLAAQAQGDFAAEFQDKLDQESLKKLDTEKKLELDKKVSQVASDETDVGSRFKELAASSFSDADFSAAGVDKAALKEEFNKVNKELNEFETALQNASSEEEMNAVREKFKDKASFVNINQSLNKLAKANPDNPFVKNGLLTTEGSSSVKIDTDRYQVLMSDSSNGLAPSIEAVRKANAEELAQSIQSSGSELTKFNQSVSDLTKSQNALLEFRKENDLPFKDGNIDATAKQTAFVPSLNASLSKTIAQDFARGSVRSTQRSDTSFAQSSGNLRGGSQLNTYDSLHSNKPAESSVAEFTRDVNDFTRGNLRLGLV